MDNSLFEMERLAQSEGYVADSQVHLKQTFVSGPDQANQAYSFSVNWRK